MFLNQSFLYPIGLSLGHLQPYQKIIIVFQFQMESSFLAMTSHDQATRKTSSLIFQLYYVTYVPYNLTYIYSDNHMIRYCLEMLEQALGIFRNVTCSLTWEFNIISISPIKKYYCRRQPLLCKEHIMIISCFALL